MGAELAMRARAILRRAGLIWAHNEVGDSLGIEDYNAYVQKIDDKVRPTVAFRSAMANSLGRHVSTMVAALFENQAENRTFWKNELMAILDSEKELRLDIYFILIAFGCPGGVEVSRYMQGMKGAKG